MVNEVRFRDLPATNAHRCSVLMPNKMQCSERASIEYITKTAGDKLSDPNVICKHHFAVERALNEAEGVKYIAYDTQGNRINEREEKYQPPQK
jgi:hypothetical protein